MGGRSVNQRRFRKLGFTLVELLIVIIMVSIMMAIAIPKYGTQWRQSEESRMRIQLKLRREAVERFRMDTGLWPKDHLHVELTAAPATGYNDAGIEIALPTNSWRGPYLDNRLWTTQARHPMLRAINIDYSVTPPTVGRLRWGTSQTSISGENIGAW